MNTKKALGWLLSVSLGALAAPSIIGCGGVVQVGGGSGGDGGADGEGGDGEGGGIIQPGAGGGGGAAPEAIAMSYAQLDAVTNGGSGGSGSATTGVGGGPDPGTQFLMFGGGTETPTCGAPYGSDQCGGWNATVTIAPYLFQTGIIPFSHPDVDISFFESTDEGNGLCSGGGGGGFDEGQLEIVEITATEVLFVVSGVTSFFDEDPNGERVALRCP